MLRFNFKHFIFISCTLLVLIISYLFTIFFNRFLLYFQIDLKTFSTHNTNESLISYFRINDENTLQIRNQIEYSQDKYFQIKRFTSDHLFLITFFILQTCISIILIPNLYKKPYTLNILIFRFVIEFLQSQYIILTKLRIFEHYGINIQNTLLDDLSLSFRKKQASLLRRNLSLLKKFKSKIFTDLEKRKDYAIQNWISYTTLEWFLTTSIFGYDLMIYIYPLFIYNPLIYPTNPFRGCIVAYVKTLTIIQRLSTENEIRDYIKRIRHSEEYIDGCIVDLKKREKKGILPCVDAIIEICKYLEKIVFCQQNSVQNHFIYKLVDGHLKGLPDDDIEENIKNYLLTEISETIKTFFIPAMRKLIRYHYSLIPIAPKEIGLWRIPKGDDIYRFHIYYFTSTTMHPMDIQELGLIEIERCKKKIIDLVKPEYIFCEEQESFGEFMRRIVSDPKFHYPFTKKGRRDAVHQLKRSITNAWEKSKELFYDYPQSPINIEYFSIFSDVSFSYQPGPWDGSENPRITINFDREIAYSKLLNKGCAFREGVPGHHLQIQASKASNLDFFRKNFISNSFFNGWGLYAELLTVENGWMENKWEELGHYLLDLRTTAKLVVDSSIHYQGIKWDTKTALAFFEDLGFDHSEAEIEVKCIASLPGTGLSQKIGQVKLLEMREFAKSELGPSFNIKEFHSVVLENGSLPLDVLAQLIQYWIIEKKNNKSFPNSPFKIINKLVYVLNNYNNNNNSINYILFIWYN
ncbi:hypothetical protein DICPUDRAFT_59227 [Dictyostelium purpureum]|uniref:DUF885 family protein n=1 Tax=Dictyostelium purpureum TaxID=5786 RepID=F1A521_DICPU|nr:uncharacterized protein DICPUDRAFT_59227 [Dictyostelium purpureum]EGC28708.1 hypothetical protein DICPUDRAFT_59227 [Dictyostelium purpureum]|eukprot:XP_003294765.1 hypothetical protein DICPUDRAFT_59227 [Dictyostelium purpureum]